MKSWSIWSLGLPGTVTSSLSSWERLMEDTHWAVPWRGTVLHVMSHVMDVGSDQIFNITGNFKTTSYDSSIKWDRSGLVVSRRSLEAVSPGII